MKHTDFLNELKNNLLGTEYSKQIINNVPTHWLFLRKGAYIFVATPYDEVPPNDFNNIYVKTNVKKIIFCMPVIAEKGLFLVYYGPSARWKANASQHKVDYTALRPIIMQSIHFVDPESGENKNSRSSWGPIKFGFCGNVIKRIENVCHNIRQKQQ